MSVPLFLFGLIAAALGAYLCYSLPKQRRTLTAPIDGVVVRYDTGWVTVVTGGESIREPGWVPVVAYTVNGATYHYACNSGAERTQPAVIEYKTFPLLYNPADPGKCAEADSVKPGSVWAGPVIALAGIVLIVISFIA